MIARSICDIIDCKVYTYSIGDINTTFLTSAKECTYPTVSSCSNNTNPLDKYRECECYNNGFMVGGLPQKLNNNLQTVVNNNYPGIKTKCKDDECVIFKNKGEYDSSLDPKFDELSKNIDYTCQKSLGKDKNGSPICLPDWNVKEFWNNEYVCDPLSILPSNSELFNNLDSSKLNASSIKNDLKIGRTTEIDSKFLWGDAKNLCPWIGYDLFQPNASGNLTYTPIGDGKTEGNWCYDNMAPVPSFNCSSFIGSCNFDIKRPAADIPCKEDGCTTDECCEEPPVQPCISGSTWSRTGNEPGCTNCTDCADAGKVIDTPCIKTKDTTCKNASAPLTCNGSEVFNCNNQDNTPNSCNNFYMRGIADNNYYQCSPPRFLDPQKCSGIQNIDTQCVLSQECSVGETWSSDGKEPCTPCTTTNCGVNEEEISSCTATNNKICRLIQPPRSIPYYCGHFGGVGVIGMGEVGCKQYTSDALADAKVGCLAQVAGFSDIMDCSTTSKGTGFKWIPDTTYDPCWLLGNKTKCILDPNA